MGVEVETCQAGTGKTFPQKGNRLEVHYTGTLATDGRKFDSSRDRGKPFSFTLGTEPAQVIRGWEEGMLQLSLGEKATLRISSDFAYGESGYGDGSKIPPNADLVFDVELVSINGKTRSDLEKFEAELNKWAAKKLAEFDSDDKLKAKYTSKDDYAQYLNRKSAKRLRHIENT
ncbi:Fkbp1a [Symbiodinium sp. CCMP2456]|nr:Fkbp1a [Symbiodinium sp. CCMP2456]